MVSGKSIQAFQYCGACARRAEDACFKLLGSNESEPWQLTTRFYERSTLVGHQLLC